MKKGISLTVLVITIIGLIILTSAVIISGMQLFGDNNMSKSVENYNLKVISELVTTNMLNNASTYPQDANMQWKNIILDADNNPVNNQGFVPTQVIKVDNKDVSVAILNGELFSTQLSLATNEISKFCVDERGVVYYVDFTIPIQPDGYSIGINKSGSGVISLSKQEAKAGETITVTIAASLGYSVSSKVIYITGTEQVVEMTGSNITYTFVMPDDDVTLNVVFTANSGGGGSGGGGSC